MPHVRHVSAFRTLAILQPMQHILFQVIFWLLSVQVVPGSQHSSSWHCGQQLREKEREIHFHMLRYKLQKQHSTTGWGWEQES